MPPAGRHEEISRGGSVAWGLGALVILAAAAAASQLQTARPRPEPAVASPAIPHGSSARCAECHAAIVESYHGAPHANTLHRGSDPLEKKRFLSQVFHRADPPVEYRYSLHGDELRVDSPAFARELSDGWVFGSGTHAQTPLFSWTDFRGRTTAVEHVGTWYAHGGLGVTLGQEDMRQPEGLLAMGRPWDSPEPVMCFGCHSNYVPVRGGAVDSEQLQPNIGCGRCHWNAERHADEMDRGAVTTIERFSKLSPLDAIDRCGECHRRANETDAPDLSRKNKIIVRFAPVGLAQSPCFLKQDTVTLETGKSARMDCTTCHDPHRPAHQDWQYYAQVCLSCHDAAHGRATDCPKAARADNCLTCHMPKVPMNPQLEFTDHWIRVRGSDE